MVRAEVESCGQLSLQQKTALLGGVVPLRVGSAGSPLARVGVIFVAVEGKENCGMYIRNIFIYSNDIISL